MRPRQQALTQANKAIIKGKIAKIVKKVFKKK